MKKRLICAFTLLICTFFLFGCSSSKAKQKEFTNQIDAVYEHYNKSMNATSAVGKDSAMKLALSDLRKLAKMYEDSDEKSELNRILEDKFSAFVFYDIIDNQSNYIAQSNGLYILTPNDELVKYYSNK